MYRIMQIGLDSHFECKIVNMFLPIILAYVWGAQKNRLIEYLNICFGWE